MSLFASSSEAGGPTSGEVRGSCLRLLEMGDDILHCLLSWLDIGGICYLDIAVGNITERSQWLKYLGGIDNKAINEYEHCHSSIRS